MFIQNNESLAQQRATAGMAQVNGTSLYYETKGRGSPIVFVSGGGILDRRAWDKQFETFAQYYRVVRYDIRGIGKSARPQNAFSHSEDLYALLEFLKIKRAHVVGLSVGGAIAIDFAIEHPETVDQLILAAAALSSASTSNENLQSLAFMPEMVKTKGMEHLIQLTLDVPFVLSKNNSAAREKVRQIYLDNKDVFESGFPVYVLWRPIQPPPETRLQNIRARVLIIWGDSDNADYQKLTSQLARRIPHATTAIISGGTHFLNLEKPAEFNQAVLNFLRH